MCLLMTKWRVEYAAEYRNNNEAMKEVKIRSNAGWCRVCTVV